MPSPGKAPMKPLRDLPRPLRRARLVAARERQAGFCARRDILSGAWDGGEVVRRHLRAEDDDGR